jgi:hypothetical protein
MKNLLGSITVSRVVGYLGIRAIGFYSTMVLGYWSTGILGGLNCTETRELVLLGTSLLGYK